MDQLRSIGRLMAWLNRTEPKHRGCCPELGQASRTARQARDRGLRRQIASPGSSRVDHTLNRRTLHIDAEEPQGRPDPTQLWLQLLSQHPLLHSCSVYSQGRGTEPSLHLSPQDLQLHLRCPVTLTQE